MVTDGEVTDPSFQVPGLGWNSVWKGQRTPALKDLHGGSPANGDGPCEEPLIR